MQLESKFELFLILWLYSRILINFLLSDIFDIVTSWVSHGEKVLSPYPVNVSSALIVILKDFFGWFEIQH